MCAILFSCLKHTVLCINLSVCLVIAKSTALGVPSVTKAIHSRSGISGRIQKGQRSLRSPSPPPPKYLIVKIFFYLILTAVHSPDHGWRVNHKDSPSIQNQYKDSTLGEDFIDRNVRYCNNWMFMCLFICILFSLNDVSENTLLCFAVFTTVYIYIYIWPKWLFIQWAWFWHRDNEDLKCWS